MVCCREQMPLAPGNSNCFISSEKKGSNLVRLHKKPSNYTAKGRVWWWTHNFHKLCHLPVDPFGVGLGSFEGKKKGLDSWKSGGPPCVQRPVICPPIGMWIVIGNWVLLKTQKSNLNSFFIFQKNLFLDVATPPPCVATNPCPKDAFSDV